MTYDDWLSLSPEQREHILFHVWSAYCGDGEEIVVEAGRRLQCQDSRIQATHPGIYHGGEWLIHAFVKTETLESCPPFGDTEFDGFRVYYMDESMQPGEAG